MSNPESIEEEYLPPIPEESEQALEAQLLSLAESKLQMERMDTLRRKTQTILVGWLRQLDRKKVEAHRFDGAKVTGTLVQAEELEINEEALRKAMGAKAFDKLTVRKLDKKLLEQAIAADPQLGVVVAAHSSFKNKAPYIRITVKES